MELMHEEVEQAVMETGVDEINSAFIKWTFDHAFKNVCARYPEIAEKMGGGLKVGSCCTMIRRVNAQRRKAGRGG